MNPAGATTDGDIAITTLREIADRYRERGEIHDARVVDRCLLKVARRLGLLDELKPKGKQQ